MVTEFVVQSDGFMTDRGAQQAAAWYASKLAVKDSLAIEASWMTERVGQEVFEAGRPRKTSISYARFNLLRNLYMADDRRLSMREISRLQSVSMTYVTHLIDKLVTDGLVERFVDPDDRRKTWAVLTEKGVTFFDDLSNDASRRIERTWSCLNEREKRQLLHLLTKVRLQLGGFEGTGAAE